MGIHTNTWENRVRSTHSAITVAVVLCGLTALSVFISMQGWRSRFLSSDLWTAAKSAESFAAFGKIPDHGCLSSLRSYIPPGSNLMIIPGVLLFRDQRLFEFPGAALLQLGTLIGLFLLCRLYFDDQCAYLSVALYAVSALGLKFANSLWPRGHPFFAVWFFFFLGAWHIKRRSYFLACALFTWAVGMYYFLELAPLIVAVPMVYIATQPRISKKALIGTLVASILVWSPYLLFEGHRSYRDLVSQVSQRPISVSAGSIGAVSPYPIVDAGTDIPFSVPEPRQGVLRKIAYKFLGGIDILQANFTENTVLPGSAGALFALCLCGLAMTAPGLRARLSRGPLAIALVLGLACAGIACLSVGIMVRRVVHYPMHPEAVAYFSSLGVNLLVALLVLLAVSKLNSAWLNQNRMGNIDWAAHKGEVLLFASCFVAAWGITAALVGGGGLGRRIWWAWPIQIVFIVVFLNSLNKRVVVLLAVAVFGIVVGNQTVGDRVRDGWLNGWSGKDPEVLRLVDTAVALQRPAKSLSIGYLVAFPSWFPNFWTVDDGYKVGTEFDMYLFQRYGKRNFSSIDYGIGTEDKFVIVQTDMKRSSIDQDVYLAGVPLTSYEDVQHVEGYSLLHKVDSK